MISITTYLIVCPLLFLAGFVDSIAGGGGLISLPAYLLAGLPIHNALGTNKFSSCCGTMISVARFLKNGMVNLKLALPAVACGLTGSTIGAKLSMSIPEKALMTMLLVVLPVAAFCVLNKKLFKDRGEGSSAVTKRSVAIAA
ncbi:MAG: TSUP family transporter, partial [Bacteroidaceae bacterium]|nr:TSUP family transporter [Bacteroidaceae bacterium]